MIPTLYSATETQFNSNGEGKLVDAISCVVTEERNGVYELKMEYPVDGEHSDDIGYSKYILATPSDGARPQAFQIYKISTPKNGKKTILANHISYRLSHIPSGTFTASNAPEALSKLKANAYEPCPFDFMTDIQTSANYVQDAPASIRSRLGGSKGSLLDTYGGEYEFDMYNVRWLTNRGSNNGVSLRYGKNIVDLNQEQNIENTITGICPFWKDPNGSDVVELPEKVIYSEHASGYPYHRTRVIDFTSEFNEKPTVAQLRAEANRYVSEHQIGIPSVNIKVSFVPLWQTKEYADIAPLERVKLCDTVNVYFEKLKINATAKVIKTEYDVLMDRYKSISLGNATNSFADRFTQLAESNREMVSESFLQTAIARASALIQGGLGGYVVFNNNADGQPQEILVMDTPDITTAVHVIRINKNGIGFSNTGYSGTYSTAWTIDGQFNADFITAGTLQAIDINGVNITGSQISGSTITSNTDTMNLEITGATIRGKGAYSSNWGYSITPNVTGGVNIAAIEGAASVNAADYTFIGGDNGVGIVRNNGGSYMNIGRNSDDDYISAIGNNGVRIEKKNGSFIGVGRTSSDVVSIQGNGGVYIRQGDSSTNTYMTIGTDSNDEYIYGKGENGVYLRDVAGNYMYLGRNTNRNVSALHGTKSAQLDNATANTYINVNDGSANVMGATAATIKAPRIDLRGRIYANSDPSAGSLYVSVENSNVIKSLTYTYITCLTDLNGATINFPYVSQYEYYGVANGIVVGM